MHYTHIHRNLTQAYTGFVACVRVGALHHVWYWYRYSASGQAKSIGKFWYQSKPIQNHRERCINLGFWLRLVLLKKPQFRSPHFR